MTIKADSLSGANEWLHRATVMRREQLNTLAVLGALVNGISRLVHMLQCERGASNVWLCSRGQLYGPECRASKALVDETLTAFNRQLNLQTPMPGSAALPVRCMRWRRFRRCVTTSNVKT